MCVVKTARFFHEFCSNQCDVFCSLMREGRERERDRDRESHDT